MFERGFTTLELIVTLIIIGIVSVTVIPRFYKSSDFEQYGYQKELVVKLRAIQLRAMQQAHSDTCKRIFFSTNQIFLRETNNEPLSDFCGLGAAGESTQVIVDAGHSITFENDTVVNCFLFNSLGQPEDCDGNRIALDIEVKGYSTLIVSVNSEGFIDAVE